MGLVGLLVTVKRRMVRCCGVLLVFQQWQIEMSTKEENIPFLNKHLPTKILYTHIAVFLSKYTQPFHATYLNLPIRASMIVNLTTSPVSKHKQLPSRSVVKVGPNRGKSRITPSTKRHIHTLLSRTMSPAILLLIFPQVFCFLKTN